MDKKLTSVVLQLLLHSNHLFLAQFSLTFAQFIKQVTRDANTSNHYAVQLRTDDFLNSQVAPSL